MESRLRRVLAVVKVRDSARGDELRQFEIVDGQIRIGAVVLEYEGLLAGSPKRPQDSEPRTEITP